MSRTVCPWCKAPLVLKDDILVCSNTDCAACDEKYLHEALIRTRKVLDVAVDALKDIRCIYTGDQTTKPSTMFGRAAGALNKIQDIEQKDK